MSSKPGVFFNNSDQESLLRITFQKIRKLRLLLPFDATTSMKTPARLDQMQ